ncbi:MAG: pyrroline-5-carboxylate reductase, partial [Parasporobacterium sp.]|nr:pyrroline-5-carboxylate reductase [Parasporobacterium sp.]
VRSTLKLHRFNNHTNIRHIIVTIAAGVPSETVRKFIDNAAPVIRLMPNTPAAVGKGTALITYGDDICPEDAEEFLSILKESGTFEYVKESDFDITSSISGCSPAYAYMFIEAMADGAVSVGVPRDKAIRLAAGAVAGACEMILKTGKHPEQLKDEVCSPGGSTIAGVEALEKNGFRYAAAQSIIKSTEKNCSLGK